MRILLTSLTLSAFACVPIARAQTRPSPSAAARERLGIQYTGNDERQRLDLYLPPSRMPPYATVLFVHGGSLNSGDRSEPRYAALCRSFVAAGIGCASVGYRLFPEVDWPAPARDLAAAVRWVHDSIAKFGGSRSRIFLLGHSSGCALATLVTLDSSHLAHSGLTPRVLAGTIAMGCRMNDRFDTSGVDPARVARYLATDPWAQHFGGRLSAIDSFRPMRHLRAGAPPLLVLLGERERFKPPLLADAAQFVGRALDCGVDADVQVISGLGHEELIAALADRRSATSTAVVAFVRRVVAGGAPPARYDLPDPEGCAAAYAREQH